MHQQAALIILAIIVIVIILITVELGYIIYLMNSDATDVSNLLQPKRRHHHHRYEHFNPERNYPQPANSTIKEEPVELYYAAGNTEVPNDISHIRDDYYAKQVSHY